jgi:dTDP-glucose pyrophosphorylase/CBS domain-containing protein
MSTAKESVWKKTLLLPDGSLEDAIRILNDPTLKIVLVVDSTMKLLGTVTDGDIRRGLLRGLGLDSSIRLVMQLNVSVVSPDVNNLQVKQMMTEKKIAQIPIVDIDSRVLGLHTLDNISKVTLKENLFVIMAGGKGERLLPLTSNTPKPMLPLGGKPIIQRIIDRAKGEGFFNFVISLNYLGKVIEEYLGEGEKFGVNITYIRETSPLGTIGALSLLTPKPTMPLLLTNGDLVTHIKYLELLDFHNSNKACASMAITQYEWQHPFGVVRTEGVEILGFEEKPIVKNYINAGVYVLNPEALTQLDHNKYCDAPELFEKLRSLGYKTLAFPIHEDWRDIGLPNDLKEASLTLNIDSSV